MWRRALPVARRAFSTGSPAQSITTKLQNAGPISWASMALAGAIGGGVLVYYKNEKDRLQTQTTGKVTTVGKALLGGPWTLVDCASGTCVTDASFRGKHTILYFGFTHCPDICPNELVRLGEVLDKVPDLDIEPLFITVDPARDTVAQMQAYKQDFHPKLRMLCGTPDQIKDVTKAYRVYFTKADETETDDDDEEDEEYLVDHSIVMYLIGPDGEFMDFFTQSARVDDIVKKVRSLVAPK
ncbi:SCO1 family protein [Achlya hypogyna]|uniref:SCO1 family protein n=1 Tax=Achlya hypogyna TaxID=1202772 RepID=A0A1V9YUU2_ACHHY|nr:SCO1 family protein [Achlya hypogyna]